MTVLLLAALLAQAEWRRLSPSEFPGAGIESDSKLELGDDGLHVAIEGAGFVELPLPGAQELELELAVQGLVTMTYASDSGQVSIYGPPWRYRGLDEGLSSVRVDMRRTRDWGPTAKPVLVFRGTSTITLRELRFLSAPGTVSEALAALDRSSFWAPESIGHTTINFLTPAYWSLSRNELLPPRIAVFAGLVGLLVFLSRGISGKRWRTGPVVAIACLSAFVTWDVYFLVRFLPITARAPRLSPEARIRENYYFDREFGELAALARGTLDLDEHVGVMGHDGDWFTKQTLCFLLFPRRCTVLEPEGDEGTGPSIAPGRLEGIDAIVFRSASEPLPPGFEPVARLSSQAFVARRR